MFWKSIRWKLQMWQSLLLGCVLLAFGITSYELYRRVRLEQVDEDLKRRIAVLADCVRMSDRPPPGGPGFFEKRDHGFEPPRVHGPKPPMGPPPDAPGFRREVRLSAVVQSQFASTNDGGHFCVIWSRSGELLQKSEAAPEGVPFPEASGGDTETHFRMRGSLREAYHFTERADGVLVGVDMAAELQAIRHFAHMLILAGAALLAMALGGGGWLASRMLRPLRDICDSANRISSGHLSERMPLLDADTELGQLTKVLNSAFSRLEIAFARQRQFTADASHELRTPLAVIITEAQSALRREREAKDYRESLDACLQAAQEMGRLTDVLLELARFDSTDAKLQRTPVDLEELIRLCIEQVEPLAAPQRLQIQSNLQPCVVPGDPGQLGQLITNLLTNAIQFNQAEGRIQVQTRVDNQTVVLTVSDTGRGIAPQDLPRIFDRFFRADKSRSRAAGHYGLGLAICKAVVEAHGGTIEAASPPGAGAIFTIRLPLEKISI